MSTNQKPNVLFILADEWRAQATGYSGDPNLKTPHLDQLAKESLNVSHAVSGLPVCCPYRASLMTGRYPIGHGVVVNDMELDPSLPNLGMSFSEGGYDTAYIGKWHIYGSPDGKYTRRTQPVPPTHLLGFKSWRGFECNHDYWDASYFEDGGTEAKTWEGYEPFAQTDQAIDYIKNRKTESEPYFMILSWGPPHFPLHTAPDEYRKRFENREIILRENVPESKREQATEELRGYYAHIEALDDALGLLLEAVDAHDPENTMVVFTADHGDMSQSHGLPHKLYPFEESIGVPFLCRWPLGWGRDGRELALPLDAPDLMPTLQGLCGLPQTEGVQGRDYSSVLRGDEPVEADACAILNAPIAYAWLNRMGFSAYRGVRTARHTYVRLEDGRGLLYDLVKDPYQLENLFGLDSHAELQTKMETLLLKRLDEIDDPFESGKVLTEKYGVGHYDEVSSKPMEPDHPHFWAWPSPQVG